MKYYSSIDNCYLTLLFLATILNQISGFEFRSQVTEIQLSMLTRFEPGINLQHRFVAIAMTGMNSAVRFYNIDNDVLLNEVLHPSMTSSEFFGTFYTPLSFISGSANKICIRTIAVNTLPTMTTETCTASLPNSVSLIRNFIRVDSTTHIIVIAAYLNYLYKVDTISMAILTGKHPLTGFELFGQISPDHFVVAKGSNPIFAIGSVADFTDAGVIVPSSASTSGLNMRGVGFSIVTAFGLDRFWALYSGVGGTYEVGSISLPSSSNGNFDVLGVFMPALQMPFVGAGLTFLQETGYLLFTIGPQLYLMNGYTMSPIQDMAFTDMSTLLLVRLGKFIQERISRLSWLTYFPKVSNKQSKIVVTLNESNCGVADCRSCPISDERNSCRKCWQDDKARLLDLTVYPNNCFIRTQDSYTIPGVGLDPNDNYESILPCEDKNCIDCSKDIRVCSAISERKLIEYTYFDKLKKTAVIKFTAKFSANPPVILKAENVSIYDEMTHKLIKCNASTCKLTIIEDTILISLQNLGANIHKGTLTLTKAFSTQSILSEDHTLAFNPAFPISVDNVFIWDPTDPSASTPDTTIETIARTAVMTASVVRSFGSIGNIAFNPSGSVNMDKMMSEFLYLKLVSGPFMYYPELIFKYTGGKTELFFNTISPGDSLRIKIDGKIQDKYENGQTSSSCVVPKRYAEFAIQCSLIANYGGDLVALALYFLIFSSISYAYHAFCKRSRDRIEQPSLAIDSKRKSVTRITDQKRVIHGSSLKKVAKPSVSLNKIAYARKISDSIEPSQMEVSTQCKKWTCKDLLRKVFSDMGKEYGLKYFFFSVYGISLEFLIYSVLSGFKSSNSHWMNPAGTILAWIFIMLYIAYTGVLFIMPKQIQKALSKIVENSNEPVPKSQKPQLLKSINLSSMKLYYFFTGPYHYLPLPPTLYSIHLPTLSLLRSIILSLVLLHLSSLQFLQPLILSIIQLVYVVVLFCVSSTGRRWDYTREIISQLSALGYLVIVTVANADVGEEKRQEVLGMVGALFLLVVLINEALYSVVITFGSIFSWFGYLKRARVELEGGDNSQDKKESNGVKGLSLPLTESIGKAGLPNCNNNMKNYKSNTPVKRVMRIRSKTIGLNSVINLRVAQSPSAKLSSPGLRDKQHANLE